MTFEEAKIFKGAYVIFETDALEFDHVPKKGTGTVQSITPNEIVIGGRDAHGASLVLPLWRVPSLYWLD